MLPSPGPILPSPPPPPAAAAAAIVNFQPAPPKAPPPSAPRVPRLNLAGLPPQPLPTAGPGSATRNPITGEMTAHTARFYPERAAGPSDSMSVQSAPSPRQHDSTRSVNGNRSCGAGDFGGGVPFAFSGYEGEVREKDARLAAMATTLLTRERQVQRRERELDAREMQLVAMQDILTRRAEPQEARVVEVVERSDAGNVPRDVLARLRDATAELEKLRGELKAAKATYRQLQVQNQQLVMATTSAAVAEKRAAETLAEALKETAKMQQAATALSRALEATRASEARLRRDLGASTVEASGLRERERLLEDQLAGHRDRASDLAARLAAIEAERLAEALATENDPNNPRNKLFRAQQEVSELKGLLANKMEALRVAEEEKDALKVSVANAMREMWQTKGALAAAQAEASRLLSEAHEYQDAERRRLQEEAIARAKREREEAARIQREKEQAEKRRRQQQTVFEEAQPQDLAAERARYEDVSTRLRNARAEHNTVKAGLEKRIADLENQLKEAGAAASRLQAERHQREEELGFFRKRLAELIRVSHAQAFYNHNMRSKPMQGVPAAGSPGGLDPAGANAIDLAHMLNPGLLGSSLSFQSRALPAALTQGYAGMGVGAAAGVLADRSNTASRKSRRGHGAGGGDAAPAGNRSPHFSKYQQPLPAAPAAADDWGASDDDSDAGGAVEQQRAEQKGWGLESLGVEFDFRPRAVDATRRPSVLED